MAPRVPLRRLARRIRQHQPFTVTGRLLVLALAFSLLAILDDALAALLSYLLWILMLAFGCGLYYRPRLQVQVTPVPLVMVDEAFTLAVEVRNVGPRSVYDLECSLVSMPARLRQRRHSHQLEVLSPGQSTRLEFPLQATARGISALPRFKVDSLFPLAIFRFISRYTLEERVVIAPAYETLPVALEADDFGQSDQAEKLQSLQQSSINEYIRSVEYRPGMAVRRWDFPSWARLGNPTVRQFSQGTESSAVVVVDACRSVSSYDESFEAALSKAAGIVDHVIRQEKRCQLVLVESSVRIHDASRLDAREELLTHLAAAEGTTEQLDWNIAWNKIVASAPRESSLIFVLQRNNPHAARAHREAQDNHREVCLHEVDP